MPNQSDGDGDEPGDKVSICVCFLCQAYDHDVLVLGTSWRTPGAASKLCEPQIFLFRLDSFVSQILEEVFQDGYEPTDEEIQEYANFLGLDLDTESELRWLAVAGLRTPLPPDWKPCQ